MTTSPPDPERPDDQPWIDGLEQWLRARQAQGLPPDPLHHADGAASTFHHDRTLDNDTFGDDPFGDDTVGIPAVHAADDPDRGDLDRGDSVDPGDIDELEAEEVDIDAEGQDPDVEETHDAVGGGGPPSRSGSSRRSAGGGPPGGSAGWPADGVEPQLHRFVDGWLVPTLELWDRIPACWASHSGMVEELRVAHELFEAILHTTASTALVGVQTRADWHTYMGHVLDRLARGPGGECARRGEHRTGRTWDRHESAQKRRAARQATPTTSPQPPPPVRPFES